MKKDLNYIAKLEQAIAKKYGEEAVQNPRSTWTQEKEQKYLEEIKEIYKQGFQNKTSDEKIEANGFFVSKKLLTSKEDRTCPACFVYSFEQKDDVYMNKYDCCHHCYLNFVEGREERWLNTDKRVEFLSKYYSRGER
jgi:hypothetical protein|tara:strand:+ start:545 stop:955 length:411 start_codon:yes stop_codon:yes gene_type:complete